MQKKTSLYLALLLPIQILVVTILSYFPAFVERFYSNGLYPYSSRAMRWVFGWIPFSFGDVLYFFLILLILRFLYLKLIVRNTHWKAALLELGAGLSIIYAVFHLCWGLNYYRKPLNEILALENEYTQEELLLVSKKLITSANKLHSQLQVVDSLAVIMPYSKDQIFQKTLPAYKKLSVLFPALAYHPKSLKTSLFSTVLTYMGFSGYLNPFTNEAQVNGLILNYKAPTTSCHEEAHQLGFAAENDANFIAALATMHADDVYFNYSGVTFSLRYCLRELHAIDQQLGICHAEMLRPGILKNYEEVVQFWRSYRNPLEPGFKVTYDAFLKANSQKKGIHSYRYVVQLLVNYFKDKEGLLISNSQN